MKSKFVEILNLIISLILVVCIMTSCSSSTDVFVDSMNALKRGEIEKFCSYFNETSFENCTDIIKNYSQLEDYRKEFLKNIFSYFSYSSKIDENNDLLVHATIKYVDTRKIMQDISVQIALESKSIEEILNSFINSNSIEGLYLTQTNVDVVFVKEGNSIKLPYDKTNSTFVEILNLNNFLRWLVNV